MKLNIAKKLPLFTHVFAIHFLSFFLLLLLVLFAQTIFKLEQIPHLRHRFVVYL